MNSGLTAKVMLSWLEGAAAITRQSAKSLSDIWMFPEQSESVVLTKTEVGSISSTNVTSTRVLAETPISPFLGVVDSTRGPYTSGRELSTTVSLHDMNMDTRDIPTINFRIVCLCLIMLAG